MSKKKETSIWKEKYRPKKLKDLALPPSVKKTLETYIQNGMIPNIIFEGIQGTGKTSAGKVLARETNANLLYINGSKNKGIDILREDISKFAMRKAMDAKYKIVFIDESESISQSFMEALKVDMEQYSKHTRFILSTNNIAKLIEPIKSRCDVINIVPKDAEERKKFAISILKRLAEILKIEDVKFEKKFLGDVVKAFYPDVRYMVGVLQKIVQENGKDLTKVDKKVIEQFTSSIDDEFFKVLSNKNNVEAVLKLACEVNPTTFFRDLARNVPDYFTKDSIRMAMINIADYENRIKQGSDYLIQMMACLCALQEDCELK